MDLNDPLTRSERSVSIVELQGRNLTPRPSEMGGLIDSGHVVAERSEVQI
jgi:hypothetical protein